MPASRATTLLPVLALVSGCALFRPAQSPDIATQPAAEQNQGVQQASEEPVVEADPFSFEPHTRPILVESEPVRVLPDEIVVAPDNDVEPLRWSASSPGLLVHAPCQFANVEISDPASQVFASDSCYEANLVHIASRRARPIRATAGEILIRVENPEMSREVGLWIREANNPARTVFTAGGVEPGKSREFKVNLTSGTYWISCPLNPTPAYILVVE